MTLIFLFEINSRWGSSLGSSGRFELLSNADFAALLSDPPRLTLPSQGPQFPALGFETQTLFHFFPSELLFQPHKFSQVPVLPLSAQH